MADNLHNLLKKDIPLTSEIIKSTETLIVLDTNTLLKVYRDSPEQIESLISFIENNLDHLFVPYIVALEFGANYKSQKGKLTRNTKESIELLENSWKDFLNPKTASLPKTFIDSTEESKVPTESLLHSILTNEQELLDIVYTKLNDKTLKRTITSRIEEIKNKLLDSLTKRDLQFDKIIELITPRIAEELDQKTIDTIQKEGKERYASKIAPGFNDAKEKQDSRSYTIKYETKYGDLILWKEILQYYTNNTSYKNVLLITNDGTSDSKIDWLEKKYGLTIGPLFELKGELNSIRNSNLYISELEYILSLTINNTDVTDNSFQRLFKTDENKNQNEVIHNSNINFFNDNSLASDINAFHKNIIQILTVDPLFNGNILLKTQEFLQENVYHDNNYRGTGSIADLRTAPIDISNTNIAYTPGKLIITCLISVKANFNVDDRSFDNSNVSDEDFTSQKSLNRIINMTGEVVMNSKQLSVEQVSLDIAY